MVVALGQGARSGPRSAGGHRALAAPARIRAVPSQGWTAGAGSAARWPLPGSVFREEARSSAVNGRQWPSPAMRRWIWLCSSGSGHPVSRSGRRGSCQRRRRRPARSANGGGSWPGRPERPKICWGAPRAVPGQGAAPEMVGHTPCCGWRRGRLRHRRVPGPTKMVCGGLVVRHWDASGRARSGYAWPGRRGDGRRSCAAAACSRRVDAPLKGLPWGGGTATMAVLAGRGSGS